MKIASVGTPTRATVAIKLGNGLSAHVNVEDGLLFLETNASNVDTEFLRGIIKEHLVDNNMKLDNANDIAHAAIAVIIKEAAMLMIKERML